MVIDSDGTESENISSDKVVYDKSKITKNIWDKVGLKDLKGKSKLNILQKQREKLKKEKKSAMNAR